MVSNYLNYDDCAEIGAYVSLRISVATSLKWNVVATSVKPVAILISREPLNWQLRWTKRRWRDDYLECMGMKYYFGISEVNTQ